MLTESSNPTMAKNASDVAAVTAMKAFFSPEVSNATTREKSTSTPLTMAHNPTATTSTRPVISMNVRMTFSLTLSLTPRRFTAAIRAMNNSASRMTPTTFKWAT